MKTIRRFVTPDPEVNRWRPNVTLSDPSQFAASHDTELQLLLHIVQCASRSPRHSQLPVTSAFPRPRQLTTEISEGHDSFNTALRLDQTLAPEYVFDILESTPLNVVIKRPVA